MTIGCNIWMICLKLNWFFYGLGHMLQFSQFVWALNYSVWDVFNNFLLIDATDRSKITSDKKRFFIALSLYPLSFFVNTPFKVCASHLCTKNTNKKTVFKRKTWTSIVYLIRQSFQRYHCDLDMPLSGGFSYILYSFRFSQYFF